MLQVACFDTAFHAHVAGGRLAPADPGRARRPRRPPLRLPRPVVRVHRRRGRRRHPRSRGRRAPRQRRQPRGDRGRPSRRDVDGAHADRWRPHGHAHGRSRPGRARPPRPRAGLRRGAARGAGRRGVGAAGARRHVGHARAARTARRRRRACRAGGGRVLRAGARWRSARTRPCSAVSTRSCSRPASGSTRRPCARRSAPGWPTWVSRSTTGRTRTTRPVISSSSSSVVVRVVPTDEDAVIARHTAVLLG